MKLVEPISRKLLHLGKSYLNVLARHTAHLDVKRYHFILSLICYHDGQLTQNALAQILDKDKSAMVSIINMLTTKGFVYRENNPDDRREHLLRVTEKARLAVPQIVRMFEHINTDMTQGISASDMKIFESVLHKMQTNIKPGTTATGLKITK